MRDSFNPTTRTANSGLPYSGQPRPEEPRKARARARDWAGLAVLALPTMLLGLDVTLLYLALPALSTDLRPSSTQALWIMDAYGFMIAGFLITMGTLGDRIGRRRLLMIGAAAFGAASVLSASSATAGMLIFARAALGVAGATLMPSTLALISNMFADKSQRALAIGVWATMFAVGMAAGPVVGGLMLERFGWQAGFLIALPVVGLLLALAPLLLPEYRDPHADRLDFYSVGLSLAAILPVIYGLKELSERGMAALPFLTIAAGLVFTALFVRRQLRLASPLLDVRLFADRAFSAALLVLLFGLVSVGGTMLLTTQYLQLVAGLSPIAAGLWMGPPALAMVAAGISAPVAARWVRPGRVMAGALLVASCGYGLLTQLDPGPAGVAVIVAGFSCAYFGLGAIAALGTDLVVGAVSPEKAGSAASISETVQELGIALGVALLGSFATLVYRAEMRGGHAAGLGEAPFETAIESLSNAVSRAEMPAVVVEQARAAFASAVNAAALANLIGSIILAIVAAFMLAPAKPGQSDEG